MNRKNSIIIIATLITSMIAIGTTASLTIFSAEARHAGAVDKAAKYLDEGNYSEAILQFTKAIEIDDKRADVWVAKINAQVKLNDSIASVDTLKEFVSKPFTYYTGIDLDSVNELLDLLVDSDWLDESQIDLLENTMESNGWLGDSGIELYRRVDLLEAFNSQIGNDYIHYLPDDYDNDGKEEAFVITGSTPDSMGLSGNVTIWFVDSRGRCSSVETNTYGCLAAPITVPNGKFISWCVTAGGSGTNSLIYGCNDGEWFEPDVSGIYAGFGDRNMRYMFSSAEDFDELNCSYIGYSSHYGSIEEGGGHFWDPIAFDYDENTRQFIAR